MPRASKHIAIRPAVVLLGVALAASPAAAQCNPFEFLFGGCRDAPSIRLEPRYENPAARSEAPRHAARPKAHASLAEHGGVSGKQKPLASSPEAPVGSLALFARDPTLRAGDIVVTEHGFLSYSGRGAFVPIAHDGGQLARLEQASLKGAEPTAAHQPAAIGVRKEAAAVRTLAKAGQPGG